MIFSDYVFKGKAQSKQNSNTHLNIKIAKNVKNRASEFMEPKENICAGAPGGARGVGSWCAFRL